MILVSNNSKLFAKKIFYTIFEFRFEIECITKSIGNILHGNSNDTRLAPKNMPVYVLQHDKLKNTAEKLLFL